MSLQHNHGLISAVADRTLVMASGRIIGIGDLDELRESDEVRAVIGDRLD
jgi:ABC-type branched-subunit amino acid transport system ATPase component